MQSAYATIYRTRYAAIYGIWCWYLVRHSQFLNKFNKFRTHSPSTLRHDSIGFAPPNGRGAPPTGSWYPLMFAPHCLLYVKRQADIVASWGIRMNAGESY